MKKLIGLVVMLLVLTGCSIKYEVDLDQVTNNENILVTANDETEMEDINYIYTWPRTAFYDSVTVSEGPVKLPEVEYYDALLSVSSVNLKYSFPKGDYARSNAINICYDRFSYEEQSDLIRLLSSVKNYCFEDYPSLTSLQIVVKTSRKVTEHNADSVVGNQYRWDINRDNFENKPIYLLAEIPQEEPDGSSQEKQEVEESDNLMLIILIVLGFVVVLVVLIKFANRKPKN